MTTTTFNIAANRLQDYTFDLDREVAAFYRDHPEEKERIFFIDASTMPGEVYCADEADLDEAIERLGTNTDLLRHHKLAQEKGSSSVFYPGLHYGTVLLNTMGPSQQTLLGCAAGHAVAEAYIFDHEAAHLLCENGLDDDENLCECAADAYAVLRHIQRFGRESPAIRTLSGRRAVEMIFGKDGSHFTAPVIEKIIADSEKKDFSLLTPEETVLEAQRYAADNIVNPILISGMVENFSVLRSGLAEIMKNDFTALRELGDLVLKTVMPEEFKWGASAICALLDGDTAFDGIPLPKPVGEEWVKLRQSIDVRAIAFSQPQSQSKLIIPCL